MKKFIKAVIVGYVVLWGVEWAKQLFKDENVNNVEDLKALIKKSF